MQVYGLDDAPALAADLLRQLLGGKGAGLVEMRRLGIPVPPAFVLGTPLCGHFLASGWPPGLDEAIDARLTALERVTGQRLGDPAAPLLVSVRSGAPVSMPGMMETILNLGATPITIAALVARTGNERFALDTWSRFSRMYAAAVLAVSPDDLGPPPPADASAATLRADVERVRAACIAQKNPIPDDPRAQLRGAIEAVFRSSCTPRVRAFREREGFAEAVPTAVVIQAMVFGNTGPSSGTGVAFSRNPSTGKDEIYGDFLPNAQGEEVVSGLRTSLPLAAMKRHVPHAFDELCRIMRTLERHYRDLCDVEFTVQDGALHVLQVRPGKRSGIAAARIAMEMASGADPLITREQAVRRITPEHLRQLHTACALRSDATAIASGVAASPGVVSGVVCLEPDRVASLAESGQNVILVRATTSPDDVHGMVKAAGIVTALGGMVSHAALVARGWGIAAVCGVDGLAFVPEPTLNGRALREGDTLTIDGGRGTIYLGDCTQRQRKEPEELQTLRRWSAELGIELGCDDADAGQSSAAFADDDRCPTSEFALMRALALLGFANANRLASSLMVSLEQVQGLLVSLPPEHINETPRGLQLAREGRSWLQARLDREQTCVDGRAAERLYQQFMQHDDRFKRLVADWQVRTVDGREVLNDHQDLAYDAAVRQRLCVFHSEAAPIMEELCALIARLELYRRRLARAATAVAAGDGSMIASPLKDSYHAVWFELHEELIHLTGRSRATEETIAAARAPAGRTT